MALIKRKQIDLYIKSATGNVPDNIFGIDNLAGIAVGAYSITAGDQYEIVVDKIVGAIDDIADQIEGLYFTYLVNGGGSKNLTKQATIDLKSTANEVSVAKSDLSNGVEYTFSLPSTLIVPGSLEVTTTTELNGNVTLSGNSQTITHTGTGNLTISSTNGEVYIEGSRFNGNDATIPGDLTVSGNFNVVGNVTQTAVNDVVVQDRFIKLANGNTGSVTVTGLYQQTGTSSYAGLIYNSTENQFRLFTTNTEPSTGSPMSALTAANLKIYALDANTVEFLAMGANAKEAVQDLVAATLTEGFAIDLAYTDTGSAGTGTLQIAVNIEEVAASLNLQVKTYEDSPTPNQYAINLLSESLVFSDSDTALVKKVTGVEALKVIIRGTIHQDIVYNAAGGAGNFTLDGSGNAVITLSYNVSTGEFKDILANNEYVQVFINGVKCRYFESEWTAGSASVKVYASSNTSGSYVGVGFPFETNDIFTVLYYGDKVNEVANPAVTTTTTAAPTTTTTASPVTTAAPTYASYSYPNEALITAIDSIDDSESTIIVAGTVGGQVWQSNNGGDTWSAVAVIPGEANIECINLLGGTGYWLATASTGIAFGNIADGWNVIPSDTFGFVPTCGVAVNASTIVLGDTLGNIRRTLDTGSTWSIAYSFSGGSQVTAMTSETGNENSRILAASGDKISQSTNSGGAWDLVYTAEGGDVIRDITTALVSAKRVAIANSLTNLYCCADLVTAPTTWTANTANGVDLGLIGVSLKANGTFVVIDGSTNAYRGVVENLTGAPISMINDGTLPHAGSAIGGNGKTIIVIAGQTGISVRL